MSRTFLYFAYGSNLLSARLRERTPSASPVGVARLLQYELRWHKAGKDGSGKCDVVHVPGSAGHVQGVVYQIALQEKSALDAAEALGVGYAEREIEVHLVDKSVRSWAYMALQVDPSVVPFDWYKALVVAGAKEHGIESNYVRALESVTAKSDPDPSRAEHHLRLLGAA